MIFGLKVFQLAPVAPHIVWCLNQPRQRVTQLRDHSTCIVAHKLIALTLLNAVYIDLSKYN